MPAHRKCLLSSNIMETGMRRGCGPWLGWPPRQLLVGCRGGAGRRGLTWSVAMQVASGWPRRTSHSRTARSLPPLHRSLPSAVQARQDTPPGCAWEWAPREARRTVRGWVVGLIGPYVPHTRQEVLPTNLPVLADLLSSFQIPDSQGAVGTGSTASVRGTTSRQHVAIRVPGQSVSTIAIAGSLRAEG